MHAFARSTTLTLMKCRVQYAWMSSTKLGLHFTISQTFLSLSCLNSSHTLTQQIPSMEMLQQCTSTDLRSTRKKYQSMWRSMLQKKLSESMIRMTFLLLQKVPCLISLKMKQKIWNCNSNRNRCCVSFWVKNYSAYTCAIIFLMASVSLWNIC